MSKNIYANTDPTGPFPGYVSLNQAAMGVNTLTVRSRGNDGRDQGHITMSDDELRDLAESINAHLGGTTTSFGMALEALKAGKRVARDGWNGKGMWLSLSCNPGGDAAAGSREIASENFWSNNNSEYARQNGGSAVVLPCITMKTATGEILMGWLASQSDMLADDWVVVETIAAALPVTMITFDAFVQYGREHGTTGSGNMPWSFIYMGNPVSHENDQCYLISIPDGKGTTLRFTPDDVLYTLKDGKMELRPALDKPTLLAAHSLAQLLSYWDRLCAIPQSCPRITVGEGVNMLILDLATVDAELTLRGSTYGAPRYSVKATPLMPNSKSA